MNVPKPRPKRKEQIRKLYSTELNVLTRQELLKKAHALNIGSTDSMDVKTLTRAIAIAVLKEEVRCK